MNVQEPNSLEFRKSAPKSDLLLRGEKSSQKTPTKNGSESNTAVVSSNPQAVFEVLKRNKRAVLYFECITNINY